jgi:hypothetical protein
MKNDLNELTIDILQENRKKLSERIAIIDQLITDYKNNNGQKSDGLNAVVDTRYFNINMEADEQEILNIFRLAERPLMTSEIKNYLDNNLGISFPHTLAVLKKLKGENKLAHLRLNNATKLSYWVMNEWVDWQTAELKRPFRKFGITKNYSIRSIEFF